MLNCFLNTGLNFWWIEFITKACTKARRFGTTGRLSGITQSVYATDISALMQMEPPIIDFKKCGLLTDERDLEDKDLLRAGNELYQAFSSSGFAYISGTGIDREFVENLNTKSNEFFCKSQDFKNGFYTGEAEFGYDIVQRTNPTRPRDRQESFHMSGKAYTSDVFDWPDVPDLKRSMTEFSETCKRLALRILRALGLGMKLKDPLILERSHKLLNGPGNLTALKLNKYPAVTPSEKVLPEQLRVGEHSDWGTITLLFQDNVGGLQIETPSGNFIDVKPIPDTVVLNVADMLSLWSENRLKSTVHRVVIPNDLVLRNRARRSISYFVNADDDTVLSRLEYESMENQSLHEKNENKRETMRARDYIRNRHNAFYVVKQ